MVSRLSISVLSSCLSLLVAAPHAHLVTPAQWAKVIRVHHCEGDPWHLAGPTYQGGLGWRPATWLSYRAPWMPTSASLATPQEQAWAMVRFVARTLHYWPDQSWPAVCGTGY